MVDLSLILWDFGGVLLSDAWDHTQRKAAAEHFGIDWQEFEGRHERVVAEFEQGRLPLAEYLSETVFHQPRSFSREAFRSFMFDQSRALPEPLAVAKELHRTRAFVTAALNNESLELNEHRIRTFGLRGVCDAFFSSCYTGRRKPDASAYLYALQVTQRTPEETLFLDDRKENVEAAAGLGLRTVWVRDPSRLREELASHGIPAR